MRAAARLGLGVLAFFITVKVIWPAPNSILGLGLVNGMLSAMVAVGLVLIYRANRIVNFAQFDIGGVVAILAALLIGKGMPFFPACAIGLLTAIALGALMEITIIRRFARAPRLQLTVATIGIAQVLQVIELVLPKIFNVDATPQPPQPFKFTWNWFPYTFTAGHLLIIITVPLTAAALALFLRRSRFGIGIRAAAESTDRAALLGIPTKRLNTIVWMLAGGLSGMALLLRLPLGSAPIGAVFSVDLLLLALAAAVIGRMENIPRTICAALVLGMVSDAVFFATGTSIIAQAVLFFVIIAALIFQRRGDLDRARDLGASSWRSIREVRPIPKELRQLPKIRFGMLALGAVTVLLVAFVPLTLSRSQVNLFSVGLIFAIVMCSLVLLTGWAGQITLGHRAIMATGGAVSWTLAIQGKDFFVCIGAAGLTGTVLAIALGLPALRIKGPFLAVTSLAFAVTTGTYFLNHEYFPWLMPEAKDRLSTRPTILDKFNLDSDYTYYYVILLVLVFFIAAIIRMRRSRSGRVLIAQRDNGRAAQSYGISLVRAQLTAFAFSGFMAGVAGGLYLFHQRQLSSTIREPAQNLFVFSIGVLGGLGSVFGALLAAAYLYFVNYSPFTRAQQAKLFASGAGLLLILMVRPDGLGGAFYSFRDAVLRRIAKLRGVVVPSLLADVRVENDTVIPLLDDVEAEAPAAALAPSWQAARETQVPDDALLVVRGLDVAYDKAKVLFGVDFHVSRGEIVALLGTNGAGKSTLLSAVCGLVKPEKGTITYDGTDITGAAPVQTVGRGLSLMPGGKGVFPTLTVAENLQLAAWIHVKDPEYVRQATEQVLEFFPILRERWDQRAGNLSGGEQQMLTLSQAFLSRPELLMIDELSLGLAPIIVEQLLEIVRAIHRNGTTVVLVEQSVNVAITLAERAVFLEKGEVRFNGPTAELLERPELLRAVFLEGAATKRTEKLAGVSNGHDHGFTAACAHCGHTHPIGIELIDISVAFGGIRAVNDVSFSVHQGQIIGMIGPNGAGKTTILDIISGFNPESTGRVLIGGQDISDLPPDQRALAGLGRSFQDARLFPSMTVRDTIATAYERHVEVPDPLAAFVLSPAVKISEREVDETVEELIELMHLQAYADKFVGELSTGTRRIVDLACVLAHKPTVLLLDEPSSGIAQRETEALAPVLLDIRDKTGAALIVIEHDMPLITTISDELVALELGTVIARGNPHEVVRDPRVVSGYLGSSEAAINRSGPSADATPRRRRAPLQAAGR